MKTTSATADFDQRYQTHLKHLKLKGLQPKTIDAYSRAIRRMGDYFDHQIDNLSPAQLTDYFSDLVTGLSPSWMSGSDGASACATGSSGAGRAPRSRTCWLWA